MNEQIIKNRKELCEKCPIFNPMKKICNPKLWINPETDEVSSFPKNGYIKGCGCAVYIKMKNLYAHCVAGKW